MEPEYVFLIGERTCEIMLGGRCLAAVETGELVDLYYEEKTEIPFAEFAEKKLLEKIKE